MIVGLVLLLLWLPTVYPATASSITLSKRCYVGTESIVITFKDGDLKGSDWIGVFHSTDKNSDLRNFVAWSWTCGSQSCSTDKASGTIPLTKDLPANFTYKAAILRDGNPPFTPLAVSVPFTVTMRGQDCTKALRFNAAHTAILGVRTAVRSMVARDVKFSANLLRMIFHDCIDVCDGCVDLTNLDNSGLAGPIDKLAPLVAQFATAHTGMSRTDVWVTAAVVGIAAANHGVTRRQHLFLTNTFGRVDCEKANQVCRNAANKVVPCGPKRGPHRITPDMNLNTSGVFSYFKKRYNFTKRQSVVALGGHAIGALHRQDSGINGPDGWNIRNTVFHNEYYQALLGSSVTPSDSVQTMISKSPNWQMTLQNNTNFSPKRPSRRFWRLFVQNKRITMLNADVAIVRQLDNSNMNPTTGAVRCSFNSITGSNVCRPASTIRIAAQMGADNDLFLNEFRKVLDLIVHNGYRKTRCGFTTCPVTKK